MKIYKALSVAQGELAKIGVAKQQRNAKQGYMFRGIDDLYNAVAPILADAGVIVIPTYTDRTVSERKSQQGGVLFHVVVRGEFVFAADDGSKVTVVTFGEAMDSADKATNKAMSAALKYALIQTLLIPTEGDNDADASHPEPAAAVDRKPPVAKPVEKTPYSQTAFETNAPRWQQMIAEGKTTPEAVIAKLESQFLLSANQKAVIAAMRQDDIDDLPVMED